MVATLLGERPNYELKFPVLYMALEPQATNNSRDVLSSAIARVLLCPFDAAWANTSKVFSLLNRASSLKSHELPSAVGI